MVSVRQRNHSWIGVGAHDERPMMNYDKLLVAILLSATGGFLDGFSWVGHGNVLANTQTANIVLFSVFATAGNWPRALRHVPPILAFIGGVITAHLLRVRGVGRNLRSGAFLGLMIEIVVLSVICVLPDHGPNLRIVSAVAFTSALQATNFTRADGVIYSSIMTTNNLRNAAEGLIEAFFISRDRDSMRLARASTAICVSFGIGAGAGGYCTARLGNVAVIVPITALIITIIYCMMLRPAGHAETPRRKYLFGLRDGSN